MKERIISVIKGVDAKESFVGRPQRLRQRQGQGEKKMARADPQTTTNDYDEFNDKDDEYDNGQRIR